LPRYHRLFTDTAGNDARVVYLDDAKKGIEVREQVGEIARSPLMDSDRNPFLASFKFKGAKFTLANVPNMLRCERSSGACDISQTLFVFV
jgi:hypothetical protein